MSNETATGPGDIPIEPEGSAHVEEYSETGPANPGMDNYYLAWLSSLFGYDELHIRQKILAISEKYYLNDEYGQPRFYVVRPPRLLLNVLLRFPLTAIRIGVFVYVISMLMQTQNFVAAFIILFIANFVLGLAAVLMSPYRDIAVYTDDTESWRILTITQDNKVGLYRRYTLYDCFGNETAKFRRSSLWAFVRIVWYVETPDGQRIMRVREDSLVRSLLRRYLGPLYGILRTNFNFEYSNGEMFGKYDRKLSLRDEYVLNLRGDPQRHVDRRVTLAMSILLDTGEAR